MNSAWPASWGGGEKWTIEAADWFRAQAHDVLVVGRPVSKLVAAAQGRGLPALVCSFGGDFDPLAVRRARRILATFRAELVVVNFNKEAWQFGRAARRLSIPVIARHGFPLLRKRIHHRWLAQKVLTRIVVNARVIRDEYAALGIDVTRIPIIHNGVPFRPQEPGELRHRFNVSDSELLILSAGRIESQKRFDRIVEVASRVIPDFPRARFLIAGEGPDRAALESDVRSCGLHEHILFTGFLPDLAEIIGDADIFLLTSAQEGTPNVLLEAMAAGVPCVSSAVGSVPEIFTKELSDYAVIPGDVEAMTKRVRDLASSADLRRRLGTAMRERARTEFAFDKSMQEFEQLFEITLRRQS